MAKRKKFDPMGSGYDYETAIKGGMRSDKTKHWGSRDPATGVILKGRRHKTFSKTQAREELAGYELKYKGGRYRSKKKKPLKFNTWPGHK